MIKEVIKQYIILSSTPILGFLLGGIFLLLGYTPWYIALICVIVFTIIPLIIILFKELKIRNGQIQSLRNIERELHVNAKILNDDGDLTYNSRIKVTNKVNSPLEYIYREFYSTPGDNINLSVPKVIRSNYSSIDIKERYRTFYVQEIKINNKEETHHFVSFEYKLIPPLYAINDFIEYEFEITANKHAKSAFTKEGLIEGFIVKNVSRSTSMTVSAPINFKIALIDFWIEDQQGQRIEDLKTRLDGIPHLIENDCQINWKINFPMMNYLYLFKFRVLKN